jgi:two-component system sensor histidine kinase DesK
MEKSVLISCRQEQRHPAVMSGEPRRRLAHARSSITMERLPDTWRAKPPGSATPIRSDEADLGRGASRLWLLFVVSWPVFVVVVGPVVGMLGAANTSASVVAAMAWTAAFLAAYLWLTLNRPFQIDVTPATQRARVALLALLAALILYADLANDPGYFWLFICVFVPAGIALPPRAAAWTVVGITALATGIEVVRWGWSMALQVTGIAIWGVSTIMLRQMVLTVDELKAAREERARLAVAEERLRFARDLHDLLGHSLSLIALKSELAGRLLRLPAGRAAAEIEDIELVSRRALREVREAVAGYRRPTLSDELESARQMLATAGIETRIGATAGVLPGTVDAVLAWAVREGVTNVIRHSEAGRCEIDVRREDGLVRARVMDDGRGALDVATFTASGSGLSGIAERAAVLGGRVDAGPSAAGGFELEVTVPVDGSAESAVTLPAEETVR